MKKRIISSALVLLMILAIFPCAAFAYQSLNLGEVAAGQPISYQISTSLSPDSTVSCEPSTLPAGCELKRDASLTGLTLSGTPSSPGSYSFNIDIGAPDGTLTEQIACSLSVTPSVPEISVSADVSCYVGGTALLSASAYSIDGTLSYQWYYSSAPASSGGTTILGANSPEYYADTANTGTSYYYCEVTNNAGGMTAKAVSRSICVSVSQPVVQSIMVNTMPSKTRYIVGESVETAGASIVVNYGDGSQQVLNTGFNVYPTVFTAVGQVSVELSYGGKSCYFPVTVMSEEDSVQSISIMSMPAKTTYTQGDSLDPAGLVFRVNYSDGSYKDVDSGYTYAPNMLLSSGSQTITITYKGKTASFTVQVAAKEVEKKLEVGSTPAKLTYNVGDSLDTAGLVIRLTEDGASRIIRDGYTCEPSTFSRSGSQSVTVRYGGLTTSFTVMVNAAASPAVSASPAPSGSPDAAATPAPTPIPHQPHKSSGNGVLVAIMIVALLCLIGLGVYMLAMNAGGWQQLKNRVEYRIYKIKAKFRKK